MTQRSVIEKVVCFQTAKGIVAILDTGMAAH
jgi:hypothetical protein